MKHFVTTLDNGLRIVTAEMSEAHSVAASVMVGVGSRYEEFGVNGGASHFLEHLLFQGTVRRPTAKQLAEEIDAVGGWNDAYTSNELTNYYVKVPRQHGALALDILSDLVQNPLFDADELERERNVIIEEMGMIKDDLARCVGDMLTPLLWSNDPLGRPVIGSEEVVQRISRLAIIEFKERYYRPNNIVVSVAGQISHQSAVEQISRQMGGMVPGPITPHDKLQRRSARQFVSTEDRQTSQTHMMLGCQAFGYNHPDEVAARAATTILGQGPSSRLHVEIRERQALAYDVSSDYSPFTDSGMLEIYAGVNNDKTEQAVEALLGEVDRMRQGSVEKNELLKAKNQLRGALQMSLESNSNVADRLGSQLLLLGKIKSLEELLAEIDAVTVEDVNSVAAELLQPERLRLAVIGSAPEKVKSKFEEIVGKHVKSEV